MGKYIYYIYGYIYILYFGLTHRARDALLLGLGGHLQQKGDTDHNNRIYIYI